jgi:anti-sigma regulatory factor (Ser/Thr protein kinase)
LLHRQLALLDDMERRVTDPEDLAELFRIDHLATRMRRHAEDLVILAGATPGRAWRYPVALTDVLRAAAAEVEQYTRISVRQLAEVAVAGRAVGDTVHLVAELLENATAFSPPDTQVTVSAQLVPHGFAIEIEDRGLGMTPDALAEVNARLSTPPDFHAPHSTRLGLFVVTRLAAKHGIAVTLRRSPFGGITAVALLPPELVVAEADAVALASSPARAGTRMLSAVPAGSPPSEQADTSVVEASGAEGEVVSDLATNADGASADATSVDATGVDAPARPHGPGVPDGRPTVPRQRALTLVSPAPPASTVRGLTPDGLPQRVRPSGRGDRAVRIARGPATEDVETDSPATSAPVRTDADATVREAPRTPERMRTMLTSFQDGTARGRRRVPADAVPTAGSTGAKAADPPTDAPPADTDAGTTNSGSTDAGSTDTGGTDTGEAGGPDR